MTDGYKIKRVLIWQNNVEKQIYPASRLPSAYQEVEWICRNGNNYIDTLRVPNQASGFKVEIGYKSDYTSSRNFLFGNYTSGSGYYGSLAIELQSSRVRFFTADGSYGVEFSSSNYVTSGFNDITITANGGSSASINLNGTTTNGSILGTSTNLTAQLFVDRDYRYTTFSQYEYISYFKAYDNNGTLVRDMIPCYRKSDSVIGFYDAVNKVFYTNKGSGTFSKGPDVN